MFHRHLKKGYSCTVVLRRQSIHLPTTCSFSLKVCMTRTLPIGERNLKNETERFSEWTENGTKTVSLGSNSIEICVSSCSPLVVSINHFENFNHLSYPQGNQRKDVSFSLGEDVKGDVMSFLIISSIVATVS